MDDQAAVAGAQAAQRLVGRRLDLIGFDFSIEIEPVERGVPYQRQILQA